MNIFGLMVWFKKAGYEGGPFILAFILGPLFENTLRQSLMMSKGSFSIFYTRPIALACLVVAFIVLVSPLIFKKRMKIGDSTQ
jgi:putative tricarboxylic transport membrane protein